MAAAPVALAEGIMVGFVRSMEMLSLQAALFGVGIAGGAGFTLVSVMSKLTVGG